MAVDKKAILMAIKPKSEPEAEVEVDEEVDLSQSLKDSAAQEVLDAIKSNDKEGLISALSSLISVLKDETEEVDFDDEEL